MPAPLAAAPPRPRHGVAARAFGLLLLPVLVVLSAALFVAFGAAILSLLVAGGLLGFVPLIGLPIGALALALLVLYLLIATPVGMLRRATLRLARGG